MAAATTINEIENELKDILATDKKSWVRIYELMNEVDTGKLYEGNYKSFTAWVNDFAENKAKVHVSLLWERLKAGRFYSKYQERAAAKGVEVKPLENIKVAPTTLVLADKISGNNEEVSDELIEKIVDGTMTRSDLKNAWATVKAKREEAGLSPTRKNSKEKVTAVTVTDKAAEITATDIIFALNQSNGYWIANQIENRFNASKYKLFSEFAVHPGTSIAARRMDALIIETLSVQSKTNDTALHGIEIKVSKSDLLKDKKMEEYTPFCDYFWLAVPDNLEAEAKSIMIDGWGLLLIDRVHKDIKVSVQAKKHNAAARGETISTALLKLL